MPRFPRALRGFWLVIGSLFLFEGLLQILSVLMLFDWTRRQPAPRLSRGETAYRVVCLGDSFTYGLGASSAAMSYPNQLAQLLASASPTSRWDVVNLGWPGMTSQDALKQLPELLERIHPSSVVLMIGTNDRWNFAPGASGSLSPDPARWQWRFRTGRLIRLLLAPLRHPPRRPSAAPAASADDHPPPDPWKEARDVLWVTQDYAAAEARFRTLLAEHPAEPRFLIGLGFALQLQFRTAEAFDAVRPLANQVLAGRRVAALDLVELAQLVIGCGDEAAGEDLAQLAVVLDPQDAFAWLVLTRVYKSRGRYAEAYRCLAETFDLQPDNPLVLQQKIAEHGKLQGSLEQAYRDIVHYYALTGNVDRPRETLGRLKGRANPALFEQIVHAAALPMAQTETLRQLFRDATAHYRPGMLQRLAQHLGEIRSICRQHHAALVIVGYPDDKEINDATKINVALRDFALAHQVPFLDVGYAIQQTARDTGGLPRHFMVRDGHLNDRGYRVEAELVATQLIE